MFERSLMRSVGETFCINGSERHTGRSFFFLLFFVRENSLSSPANNFKTIGSLVPKLPRNQKFSAYFYFFLWDTIIQAN